MANTKKIIADAKAAQKRAKKTSAAIASRGKTSTSTAVGTPFGQAGSQAGSYVDSFVNSPSNFTYGSGNPLNTEVDPYNSVPKSGTPTGTGAGTPNSNGLLPGETVNGNQLLLNGKPFAGMKNGILFVNGYRQDQYNPDGTDRDKPNTAPPMATGSQLDSIAGIKALLSSLGIGDLTSAITNAVIKGYSSDTIELIMQDPNSNDELALAFQKRFPANKIRAAAVKSVLSAAEYLSAERSYTQVLQSYGVASLASREKLSSFISNDISSAEVSDRVGLAVNRVQNADADTKKMLAKYYPMLNQGDIVNAVLDPVEGLPALQRKVQLAEIGGAALTQGLTTNVAAQTGLQTGYQGVTSGALGAGQLADLGITKQQARSGYEQVAEVTPRAEFLSSITGGEDYTRLQAEQEVFQGLASAKRARVNLTQAELARFGGSSGKSKTSLGKGNKGSF